jgi:hypothetical protein
MILERGPFLHCMTLHDFALRCSASLHQVVWGTGSGTVALHRVVDVCHRVVWSRGGGGGSCTRVEISTADVHASYVLLHVRVRVGLHGYGYGHGHGYGHGDGLAD